MNGRDMEKFRKVVGMLGSDHDGERANAARLATSILKNNGMDWSKVSLNGFARQDGPADVAAARMNAALWRRLLEDEQRRTTALSNQVLELKRQLERALVGKPQPAPGPQAKPKAAPPPREPQGATSDPGDAELRAQIDEALELDSLPERTREFLESVAEQSRWTEKQRAAVEKSLRWVFK